jgi:flagellin
MVAIDQGVGALVDADMNEESTKLQALQVQQQLGIQALSIANQNSQMVLSLFR